MVLGLALTTLGPTARAEDPVAQKVEKLAADAATAYHAADYQRAVELLERAYQLRQVGELLYNLAKAYEKLGDQDKAVEYYRRYMDSTESDPKLRQRALARVTAYEATHRPKPVEPPPEPRTRVEVPPPVHVETPEERQAAADARWKAKKHHDAVIGLALEGTGLACAIAGAGLWGGAYAAHTAYAPIGLEADKRSDKRRALIEAGVGDGLWGAAAVFVAVGSYYVWRGYHHEVPPKVTAAPLITPNAAGLLVGGRF